MTSNVKRMLGSIVLVAVLLSNTACESILIAFKSGFAASKPFVQALVDSKVIQQELANKVLADIDDGINALVSGDACIKAIPKDDPGRRVKKAKCYFEAAQKLRTILDRHNFQQHEMLNRISTIVSGAIAALEAYYSHVTSEGVTVQSDKMAEDTLKAKLKDAEAKLKKLKDELKNK